jgi:photosynthetic reaction center cytochrome c subunit
MWSSRSSRYRSLTLLVSAMLLCECAGDTRTDAVQVGYRGTAMIQNYKHVATMERYRATTSSIPTPTPPADPMPAGPLPWQNVRVLTDVSITEMLRTMEAMATWVGGAGTNCVYCHWVEQPWSDTSADGRPLYRKLVARRMLQMVRQINGTYAGHVKNTGVTCYTCHLGKSLPSGIWFYSDQSDYLRMYLDREGARVVTQHMAPGRDNRSSVKQAEWTYALMMSQSKALGVNCTYCHNTRQFASWQQAPPQRVVAFVGMQMLRDLNTNYLSPLRDVFPAVRRGPMGDAPKLQCVTCHNGNYKPLYAAPLTKAYPALWGRTDWNGTPFPAPLPAVPAGGQD